jgi:hypothetical protein
VSQILNLKCLKLTKPETLQAKDDILLVKCADEDVEEEYGIGYLPRLIYFEGGIPEPYKGDEVIPLTSYRPCLNRCPML